MTDRSRPAALAGRPRAAVGCSRSSWSRVVVAVVLWLYGNYTEQHVDGRTSRPASTSSTSRPAFQITGNATSHERSRWRRDRRGPPEHAAGRGRRHRAGDRARHAHRHRPAVARTARPHAATVYVEVIRNVPLLCSSSFGFLAVVLGVFPRIKERVGAARAGRDLEPRDRGAVVRGIGAGCSSVVVLSAVVAGVGRRPLAPPRRRPHRRAAPDRAVGASARSALVVVVGWVAARRSVRRCPSSTGARRPAASRVDPSYFALLFALVDLHREPHRRDRPRARSRRCPAARARRPTPSRSQRLPADVVRRAARRRSASPSRRSATSTST